MAPPRQRGRERADLARTAIKVHGVWDNLASIASDDPGSPVPDVRIGSMGPISHSPTIGIVAALIRFVAAVSSTLLECTSISMTKVLVWLALRKLAVSNCGEVR
jgi:hypothetical protein